MSESGGFLAERGKILEEEFFYKENQRLLEQLRQMKRMEDSKEALAEASGITDDAVLQSLLDLHIDAQTMAALALVPLIEVAWADDYLDEKEKQAILAAAHASGLEKGHVAYDVLESWLTHQPKPKLLKTWVEYIRELRGQLSEEEQKSLKTSLLGRAESVAGASGGYLGLGFKVSKTEAAMLKTLEEAFGGD